MKRTLYAFLVRTMGIPPVTVSKMEISKIWLHEETNFGRISVEFLTLRSVRTIFKYVRNLSPGQKVKIFIPPVLAVKHEQLKSQAFHLRNGETRCKTVIKFSGNDLALYTRMTNTTSWQLVHQDHPTHAQPETSSLEPPLFPLHPDVPNNPQSKNGLILTMC